jgi:hypothetical protein
MGTAPISFLSVSEYFQRENGAEFHSEYINGQMFAIAGGTLSPLGIYRGVEFNP